MFFKRKGVTMIENAEGPPQLSPALLREAAGLLAGGLDRATVAQRLGVDAAALRRHVGPMGAEGRAGAGLA